MMFFSPWLVFPLLSTLLAGKKNRKATNANYLKNTHHMLLHQFVANQGKDESKKATSTVWIDMENVRGKSGFQLTHQEVLEKTTAWTKHFGLEEQVVVVVDHGGSQPSAFFKTDQQLAIVFSGNNCKADDVIAKGVGASCFPFDGENQHRTGKTVVVTADNELMSRCRKASKNEYHIVHPQTFLDDLEWVANEVRQQEKQQLPEMDSAEIDSTTEGLSMDEQFKLGRLDAEIRLRGQLIDAQVRLGDRKARKKLTNKRRKKLQSKIQDLERKLALKGPSLLDQLTMGLETTNDDSEESSVLARQQQDLLLARWKELQHRPPRKEQTGDRVIYAERLRRELEADDCATGDVSDTQAEKDINCLPSAKRFVQHVNGGKLFESAPKSPIAKAKITSIETALRSPPRSTPLTKEERLRLMTSGPVVSESDSSSVEPIVIPNSLPDASPPDLSTKERIDFQTDKELDSLDMVVISDTHGFEGQLGDTLPNGKVLLHLGDFALEGSHEKESRGLVAFDEWLARQPHDYKIIVRGNHDPFKVTFPKSKALYVTNPTSLNIGGFECAIVPHCNARKLTQAKKGGLPPTCDVLASHVPPFKVLDKTYSGKHVGNSFLNNFVRGMALGPPSLWLVGHIHEGRGISKVRFGKRNHRETTVINASNANLGCATHLVHGPVVLRLDKKENLDIVRMDDQSLQKHVQDQRFASTATEEATIATSGNRQLLMAVDLGLKSGVSLFDDQGRLLRYEQFLFDRENLQNEFETIIRQWESSVEEIDRVDSSEITHIAIEGGDTGLLDTWAQAAAPITRPISILRVSPEEWRSELLNKKESQNGASAKEASRLIARQIVADYGSMEPHTGKFPTDVAESVCLGMYVARRLGWIEAREPAIRRFTNGNIIVTPQKNKATAVRA